MKNIVVFGSINTDLFISTQRMPENGETIKGSHFFTSSGGKGANQAVAAARLGGDVTLLGCVGDDAFGRDSLQILKNYSVKTHLIEIIKDTPSGVAMIIKVAGDNRIILDSGANQELNASHLLSYLEQHQNEESIFICQLENNLDETIKALQLAKQHGLFTIFNPAPAILLDKAVYQYVDLLVINQSEAHILSGIYPNHQKECEKVYQRLGIASLIITLGKTGSMVINKEEVIEITGIDVQAVDTTGAGDAYIGALAFGLANDFSLHDSAKLANIVSALAVTKEGAQCALPSMNEVKQFKN